MGDSAPLGTCHGEALLHGQDRDCSPFLEEVSASQASGCWIRLPCVRRGRDIRRGGSGGRGGHLAREPRWPVRVKRPLSQQVRKELGQASNVCEGCFRLSAWSPVNHGAPGQSEFPNRPVRLSPVVSLLARYHDREDEVLAVNLEAPTDQT